MFHNEFLKVVQAKGAGWVDYMFPKPGQKQPSHKWSYVKGFKADGLAGLIGAGFFRGMIPLVPLWLGRFSSRNLRRKPGHRLAKRSGADGVPRGPESGMPAA